MREAAMALNSPKEYREFALECIRWAEMTDNASHRQVLLDMAKQWMRTALEVERSIGLFGDAPSAVSHPPVCSVCGKRMRLLSSDPTTTPYNNVSQFRYVCDCGQSSDQLVAGND
jgi:hypothetical protein